jgi:hypothetical protein
MWYFSGEKIPEDNKSRLELSKDWCNRAKTEKGPEGPYVHKCVEKL